MNETNLFLCQEGQTPPSYARTFSMSLVRMRICIQEMVITCFSYKRQLFRSWLGRGRDVTCAEEGYPTWASFWDSDWVVGCHIRRWKPENVKTRKLHQLIPWSNNLTHTLPPLRSLLDVTLWVMGHEQKRRRSSWSSCRASVRFPLGFP